MRGRKQNDEGKNNTKCSAKRYHRVLQGANVAEHVGAVVGQKCSLSQSGGQG